MHSSCEGFAMVRTGGAAILGYSFSLLVAKIIINAYFYVDSMKQLLRTSCCVAVSLNKKMLFVKGISVFVFSNKATYISPKQMSFSNAFLHSSGTAVKWAYCIA